LMPFMVSTTWPPPRRPAPPRVEALCASWLAWRALSALWRTVEPSSPSRPRSAAARWPAARCAGSGPGALAIWALAVATHGAGHYSARPMADTSLHGQGSRSGRDSRHRGGCRGARLVLLLLVADVAHAPMIWPLASLIGL
jgi:hypothetical protein